MKIKRYVAADMRAALRAVREEQGPDAVILSTRPCPQGVEVCAAVDVELAVGQGTLAETAALKQLERSAGEELAHAVAEEAAAAAAPAVPAAPWYAHQSAAHPLAGQVPAAPVAPPPQDDFAFTATATSVAASVGEELRSLRALLEQQVAVLAWNDFTRREPLKARALAELARLGLDRALALQIAGELPAGLTEEQAQRMPYALLSRRLAVCPPPAERRGALALIGPPGSGKTTTLAKLAARYVLEQDPANLLLLSTDDERLGSYEQLACLGRLLGVRVESVIGDDALAARIAALPDHCILIDTSGVASRDAEAAGRYRALRERCPALTTLLVLPASAQGGVIDDTVAHFGAPVAACCALTRIDEAVSLGGVLSALARTGLPLAWCSEGPRIPEDLRPARAHQLVARAVELMRVAQSFADDDLLARRYGGSVHGAA